MSEDNDGVRGLTFNAHKIGGSEQTQRGKNIAV